MILFYQIIFLLLTYVLGSVPVGYLLTKYYTGQNILKLGSGNIGSTNVRRVSGHRIGFITQLLDMTKGLLPVALFLLFKPSLSIPHYSLILALAAILGHDFSVFLNFKGGKGVNTTLGASLLLAPYAVGAAVCVYLLVKWIFNYVSAGSLAIALTLPLVEYLMHGLSPTFLYFILCAGLIFCMHRSNIKRLIQGNELHS